MKSFELVFEKAQMPQEDLQRRLDKAFDIIFSELEKVAELGIANPQNYVRAGEVSVNV